MRRYLADEVSVPLRGLDIRKLVSGIMKLRNIFSFSPLAGIRYSETGLIDKQRNKHYKVSVPLRGLDIRKPGDNETNKKAIAEVSVPLRGLDIRKQSSLLFS